MSFYFIKAGLQTSIQDAGRQGQLHLGISNSGAMDLYSMQLANWLVGKPANSAVIEVTLIGPKIRFEQSMNIAICGAQFDLYLNGDMVFSNETIQINEGDILEFDRLQQGARAYIAFSGELDIEPMLGSLSTHLTANFGGFHNRQFKDDDYLSIIGSKSVKSRQIKIQQEISFSGNYLIRCVESVETKLFRQPQITQFFSQRFSVTPQCNRMGIKLKADVIEFDKKLEIVSSGLTQGSIQIPPSGQPIISSVDGQTIGGYPRIANVISADLPLLGQLKAGDQLNFTQVTQSFAENTLRKSHEFHNSLMR